MPGTASSSTGLSTQLMDQFTCGVCKQRFTKPRSLPCLHSFCELCLRSLCGDELFVSSIQCPNCDKTVPVPGGNVANFPIDFLADRFLSVVMEMCPSASTSSDPTVGPAIDHIKEEKNKLFEMCYGHDKIKDQFCHICRFVFCEDCGDDHIDHAVGSVQDAAMSAVQNLSALSSNTSDRIAPLQESIEEIRQAIAELDDQHHGAEERLLNTFDELHAALDHRMNFLREELSDLRSDRVSILKMRKNEFCATIKKSLELKQAVTEVLEGDTDTELLRKEEDLGEALYTIINKGLDITNKSDEVEIDYEFQSVNFVECLNIIQNIGEIEFHFGAEDELERGQTMVERETTVLETEESMVTDAEQTTEPVIYVDDEIPGPSRANTNTIVDRPVVPEDNLVQIFEAAFNNIPPIEPRLQVSEHSSNKDRQRSNIIEGSEAPESVLASALESASVSALESALASAPESALASAPESAKAMSSNISREDAMWESPSSRQTRSDRPRKALSSRETNPCFEVFFKAPDRETIARYRDISTNPVKELGGKGHKEGELYYPYGVAVTDSGSLLVSDQGNSRVQVLDPLGSPLLCFGSEGKDPGCFNGPSGVHCHNNMFYVSDTGNNRVQVFESNGTFIKCIGEDMLLAPRGLTVHGDKLYVASSGNGRICVFNITAGEFIGNLRNRSPHNCDLQLPTGVTTCLDGGVYLTDANNFFCNHFIQVLSPEHEYKHSVGIVGNGPGEFLGPSDLAVDVLGNVIITDTRNHRIQIIDKNNNLVSCMGGFGRRKGQLHFPYGVCEKSGIIYVCDTNNHRVQVFNSPAD